MCPTSIMVDAVAHAVDAAGTPASRLRSRIISFWSGRVPDYLAEQQADWELRRMMIRMHDLGFARRDIALHFGKTEGQVSNAIRKRLPEAPVSSDLVITDRQKRILVGYEGPLSRKR